MWYQAQRSCWSIVNVKKIFLVSYFKAILLKLEFAHKSLQNFVKMQLVSGKAQDCAFLTSSQVMSMVLVYPWTMFWVSVCERILFFILFQILSFLQGHSEPIAFWNPLLSSFLNFYFHHVYGLQLENFLWCLYSIFNSLQKNISLFLSQQYASRFIGENFFTLLV